MSLYESFFYCSTCFECYYIHPQELATVCGCTRIPPYSSQTAPIHQYTPKQSSTPTYSRQLLRMNVITFETCWAIKNFHQFGSIYSTDSRRPWHFTPFSYALLPTAILPTTSHWTLNFQQCLQRQKFHIVSFTTHYSVRLIAPTRKGRHNWNDKTIHHGF